ncbi:hypothetical protein CAI21_01420 [Alkalilimnicola ehrlichii]|uniref:Zinc finger DksA/TraR C4-type domain-containing protein n=1 Tax=Alkalilimnicola ehrlichii TaxID=351052 RepID=A0A3E0X3J5_9GAMM|nr:TraR/DksA C4-type zinc finger protein [Alkalilimnicola ehrlichii]RFA31316.1 hypothetical protein CAI21_01420 [Alkalilimnicola ehrlichii]RFA39410.1 hypothetical protein CAL65_00990 [Alkalilimnicola ehrlichii]
MTKAIDIATEYTERFTEACIAARVRYQGTSRTHCIDCDEPIPERRRQTLPGVQRCVDCQEMAERR